jgi:hypothetical protein
MLPASKGLDRLIEGFQAMGVKIASLAGLNHREPYYWTMSGDEDGTQVLEVRNYEKADAGSMALSRRKRAVQ